MASAARKDPAVLPLACLVVLTWVSLLEFYKLSLSGLQGCAIYMFSNKTSEEAVRTKVPEKALMPKLPPTSKTSASMTSQLGMSGSIFGDLAVCDLVSVFQAFH